MDTCTSAQSTDAGAAGVCQEYILHGKSEGGLNDVRQLDTLLKALSFSQAKASGQIRWSVLNTIALLRQHKAAHAQLSAAMAASKPVSECIAIIEAALDRSEDT